jgi:hypothetical protein
MWPVLRFQDRDAMAAALELVRGTRPASPAPTTTTCNGDRGSGMAANAGSALAAACSADMAINRRRNSRRASACGMRDGKVVVS